MLEAEKALNVKNLKYANANLVELAQASLDHDGENCHYALNNLKLEANGETWTAYEVSIANAELLFFTDIGTLSYVVDKIYDGVRVELYNYELDNPEVKVLRVYECNDCGSDSELREIKYTANDRTKIICLDCLDDDYEEVD